MRDDCENEHHAQRISRGCLPSGKGRDTCETDPSKNDAAEDEDEQDDANPHRVISLFLCRVQAR